MNYLKSNIQHLADISDNSVNVSKVVSVVRNVASSAYKQDMKACYKQDN